MSENPVKLSELPQEGVKVVSEAITSINGTVTDIIKSNTDTGRSILRKLITASASTLSAAFVGALGYVIYRSLKAPKEPVENYVYHDIELEVDIKRLKRESNEINEVFNHSNY